MLIADEVQEALSAGRAVVGLESTIIAHGLPRPDNLRVAGDIEAAVRDAGAVPATIAVLGGEVRIGLGDAALERIGGSDDVANRRALESPHLLHDLGLELVQCGGNGHRHRIVDHGSGNLAVDGRGG